MRKPDLLRATIAKHVPDLKRDPYALRLWVENGAIIGRHGDDGDMSYCRRYRLNGVILDFAGSEEAVEVAILEFLAVEQPERLMERGDSFTFDVEIIDAKTVDLMFMVDLMEQVSALRRPDGGYDINSLPEPTPFPDLLRPGLDPDRWLDDDAGAPVVPFAGAEAVE